MVQLERLIGGDEACRISQRFVMPYVPEKGRRGRAGVIEGKDPSMRNKRIVATQEGTGQEGALR